MKKITLINSIKLFFTLLIGINANAQCTDFASATPYNSNNSNPLGVIKLFDF